MTGNAEQVTDRQQRRRWTVAAVTLAVNLGSFLYLVLIAVSYTHLLGFSSRCLVGLRRVLGNSRVVCNCRVLGNCRVLNNCRVLGNCRIFGAGRILGSGRVLGDGDLVLAGLLRCGEGLRMASLPTALSLLSLIHI